MLSSLLFSIITLTYGDVSHLLNRQYLPAPPPFAHKYNRVQSTPHSPPSEQQTSTTSYQNVPQSLSTQQDKFQIISIKPSRNLGSFSIQTTQELTSPSSAQLDSSYYTNIASKDATQATPVFAQNSLENIADAKATEANANVPETTENNNPRYHEQNLDKSVSIKGRSFVDD